MPTPKPRLSGRAVRLAIALSALSLVIIQSLPGQAQGAARYEEAIVVDGAHLQNLWGVPLAEIQVWSRRGGQWTQELVQVDERRNSAFVATENGSLDLDDQLVFPYTPGGDAVPAGEAPPGVAGDAPRAEVKIVDPLVSATAASGHAYAYRVAGAAPASPPPAVAYDTAERLLKGSGYTLGLADQAKDGFQGIRLLKLGTADMDLVDRLKIRAQASILGLPRSITEENLSDVQVQVGGPPIKSGPVRTVLGRGGLAYARRVNPLGLDGLANVGDPLGFIEVTDGRVSLDLSPEAAGATYRDSNLPAGVPVDGAPDAVPASPPPTWRELTFPMGRLVILSRLGEGAERASAYYKDDLALDGEDTGDGLSYGDHGASGPDMEALVAAGFPGEMVFLPAGSAVVAADLARQFAAPLQLTVTLSGNAAPTSGTVSVTPTATRTPGPTRSPTAVQATFVATATPSTVTPSVTPTRGEASATPPIPIDLSLYVPYASRP